MILVRTANSMKSLDTYLSELSFRLSMFGVMAAVNYPSLIVGGQTYQIYVATPGIILNCETGSNVLESAVTMHSMDDVEVLSKAMSVRYIISRELGLEVEELSRLVTESQMEEFVSASTYNGTRIQILKFADAFESVIEKIKTLPGMAYVQEITGNKIKLQDGSVIEPQMSPEGTWFLNPNNWSPQAQETLKTIANNFFKLPIANAVAKKLGVDGIF